MDRARTREKEKGKREEKETRGGKHMCVCVHDMCLLLMEAAQIVYSSTHSLLPNLMSEPPEHVSVKYLKAR